MGSTPVLGKSSHEIQECSGRRSWLRFLLDCPKFRHHLVMHRDLDARAGVSLDSADQGRQLLTGFADREFHHGLQVKISKMYSHVQDMSTHPNVPSAPLDGGSGIRNQGW
jgi:hypothetical protein